MNIKKMQKLSPDMHGIVDYITGSTLLAAPNLFGFDKARGPAAKTSRLFGALILGQAALTNYKYGLLRVLPFRMHRTLDWVLGPFIALSPFLFGFKRGRKRAAWLTPLISGVIGTIATAMTRPVAAYGQQDDRLPTVYDREMAYGRRSDIEMEPSSRGRMPAGTGMD